MEYLFLRRKKTRYTSVRQKTLLYRAALSPMGEGVCVADGRPPDRCSYI